MRGRRVSPHSREWYSFLSEAAKEARRDAQNRLRHRAMSWLVKLCQTNPGWRKPLPQMCELCFGNDLPDLRAAMESAIKALRRHDVALIYQDRRTTNYFLIGRRTPEETERKYREMLATCAGTDVSTRRIGEHVERAPEIAAKIQAAVVSRRESLRSNAYVG